MTQILPCNATHIKRYGEIYAEAFGGEPWNDPWTVDNATIHVSEIMGNPQAYGLEYIIDGEVAGFLLGTSMLFHYGRTFEINDLAVAHKYQRQGIATHLIERCIYDMKKQGIKSIHLITAAEGVLPKFYQRFGFDAEKEVMLMGLCL